MTTNAHSLIIHTLYVQNNIVSSTLNPTPSESAHKSASSYISSYSSAYNNDTVLTMLNQQNLPVTAAMVDAKCELPERQAIDDSCINSTTLDDSPAAIPILTSQSQDTIFELPHIRFQSASSIHSSSSGNLDVRNFKETSESAEHFNENTNIPTFYIQNTVDTIHPVPARDVVQLLMTDSPASFAKSSRIPAEQHNLKPKRTRFVTWLRSCAQPLRRFYRVFSVKKGKKRQRNRHSPSGSNSQTSSHSPATTSPSQTVAETQDVISNGAYELENTHLETLPTLETENIQHLDADFHENDLTESGNPTVNIEVHSDELVVFSSSDGSNNLCCDEMHRKDRGSFVSKARRLFRFMRFKKTGSVAPRTDSSVDKSKNNAKDISRSSYPLSMNHPEFLVQGAVLDPVPAENDPEPMIDYDLLGFRAQYTLAWATAESARHNERVLQEQRELQRPRQLRRITTTLGPKLNGAATIIRRQQSWTDSFSDSLQRSDSLKLCRTLSGGSSIIDVADAVRAAISTSHPATSSPFSVIQSISQTQFAIREGLTSFPPVESYHEPLSRVSTENKTSDFTLIESDVRSHTSSTALGTSTGWPKRILRRHNRKFSQSDSLLQCANLRRWSWKQEEPLSFNDQASQTYNKYQPGMLVVDSNWTIPEEESDVFGDRTAVATCCE